MPATETLSDYILQWVTVAPLATYAWSNSEDYYPGSISLYDGNYYSSLKNNNNKQPDISPDDWVLFNGFQFECDIIGNYCQDEINSLYLNPAGYTVKDYYTEIIDLLPVNSFFKNSALLAYYVLTDDTGLQGFAGGFLQLMITAKSVLSSAPPPFSYPQPPLGIKPYMDLSLLLGVNTVFTPVPPAPPLSTELDRLILAFNAFLTDAFFLEP